MSQCSLVLEHLQGNSITQDEAKSLYGIARLASRIDDLKRLGYEIRTDMIEVKNRYGAVCKVAKYSLEPIDREWQQHEIICMCGMSYYTVNGKCNKCGRQRTC